ncbi:D-alanine--D-alanine ligase [Paramagnetospirillum magneticum]|uniref:D-alanine--D-alanine ligase n=1 Tax=Paramagnetospirillum magneticum (strain ATCC 700264 / AMB-1) TaxID=342108 RepID=DDL_PARM1|nr:D-alanine--D-alanine ligase [Paramagnetospirillum magneticum]Q2W0H0.1 RecName: Full=D-alanine--D-alanine ligase; AltName: Full=D-Ala-D-Ala ligase; AltName: Full=D-alanylalanine synthetase [Paramagnetospirillum magneticum AMB-1]BAE52655.1 D-alanine-D-alanine ligase and related ATP-grasp enzyme [Paramagnetospirillum magneticum AMB-1]
MSKRVTVLMGGASAERDVSLRSGAAAAKALEQAGFEVALVDCDRNPAELVRAITETRPDVVFNALHGRFGEDGCVQGVLNLLGVPYTHSGLLASAAAMDKAFARALFASAGIPVAEGRVITRTDRNGPDPLPRPFVVKPLNEGSSVGVFIVRDNQPSPLPDWPFDADEVLVESFIPGRELTAAVMGDRALGVLEITSDHGFYDYEAKYAPGGSRHLMPAPIPEADYAEACRLAVAAHKALGCRGVSRADLRYDDTVPGQPPRLVMLEVNTQPGMTATSLVPEMAAYQGITFPELVRWMVEEARCD